MIVATPSQMVEAWEVGVMHGSPGYAQQDLREHPPTIDDPTYHRADNPENGGWSRARNIANPSAIASMRAYLKHKGLRAPNEVEAAWEITLRRRKERTDVEKVLSETIDQAWRDGAQTFDDFATAVTRRLTPAEQETN